MKHFSLLIFYCCSLFSLLSQNLVPNSSFEEKNLCPSGWSCINYDNTAFPYVQNWFSPSAATPDYFNVCAADDDIANIPFSGAFGFSPAHMCDGMAGIATFKDGSDYREYIEVELTEPMVASTQYYVEFYMAAAAIEEDLDAGFYSFIVATDEIGAYLSTGKLLTDVSYMDAIDVTPQIENADGVYPVDSSAWYKVSGVYTALGDEDFLTIGNFKGEAETDFLYTEGMDPGAGILIGYVFIDDVLVTEYAGVIPTAEGEIIICVGDTAYMTGPMFALSYLWSSGAETQTIAVTEPGTYTVSAAYECDTLIHEFTIVVLPTDEATSYTEQHICADEFPITLNGPEGFTSFEWNVGYFTAFIITDDPGLYWVYATNMCSTQLDSFYITSVDPTEVDLFLGNDTLICSNDPLIFLLDAAGEFDTYSWNTGETTASIYINEPGTYTVTAENICGTWNDAITITTGPVLFKPELGEKVVLCADDGFTEVTFTAQAQDGYYLWSTGETTQSITVHEPGIFWVECSNVCGKVRDTVVVQLCTYLYMPNAFSPNDDGVNDLYAPVAYPGVKLLSFVIYDRWGQLLFETNDITKGWDGTALEELMPVGAYAFVVHYDQFGFVEKKQGSFTLVR